MSVDWAENTAQRLLSKDLFRKGICLILGASDTGKTTLAEALTKQLVKKQPVGVIDADIGQSHIGPPTTVGWALVDDPDVDFSHLSAVVAYSAEEAARAGFTKAEFTAGGISFVGDVTPVGHLLQLTSAIVQCVQQLSSLAEIIIIDTPGLVTGPAACALWWTVQQILKPKLILAVQKNDELNDILAGLKSFDSKIELIQSSPEIPVKSPQQRQRYRQNQFEKYFLDSCLYNISLTNVSIQSGWCLSRDALINKLVGLRDAQGTDLAVGIINDLQCDKDTVVIRAPKIDIRQVRCFIIGDVTIEIAASQAQ